MGPPGESKHTRWDRHPSHHVLGYGNIRYLSCLRVLLGTIAVTVLMTIAASPCVGADDRVLHVFASAAPDDRLEHTVYLASGVALARIGYSSGRHVSTPETIERIRTNECTREFVRAIPPNKWRYALIAEYVVENGNVVLEYTLFDTESGDPIGRAHDRFALGFGLDSAVGRLARELFEHAGIAAPPTGDEVVEGVIPLPDSGDATPSVTAPGDAARDWEDENSRDALSPEDTPDIPLPERRPAKPADSRPDLPEPEPPRTTPPSRDRPEDVPADEISPAPAPEPESPAEPARVSGLELSLRGSALVVIGDGTEFFRYGATGAASAGYTPPGGRIAVTYGGRAAFSHVFTDTGVSGGTVFVTTVGPEIQVGTAFREPARSAVRLSAGAAVVTVRTDDRTMHKTVPYAEVGGNSRIPFGERFSIGGEVSLKSIFEGSLPLIGLSTTLFISLDP